MASVGLSFQAAKMEALLFPLTKFLCPAQTLEMMRLDDPAIIDTHSFPALFL